MEGRILAGRRLAPEARIELPPRSLLRLSGMGRQRAARAAQALLAGGAESLVSWGVAGGLDPALANGTLLLPDRIMDSSLQDGLAVDTPWRARLLACLESVITVSTAPLISAETPAKNARDKARLFATGCAAVDMESHAVAQCAAQAGVPFVAVRAVADPAHAALPRAATAAMDEAGHMRPFALIGAIAASGGRDIKALGGLARATRCAEHTLATVRRLTGTDLLAA